MSENFSSHIDSITTAFNNLQRDKDIITEKYYVLFKALSVVKNNLERAIKNPSKLLDAAVYDSIDLCRSLTPYTEMSTGLIKIDPPLTDEEKIRIIS